MKKTNKSISGTSFHDSTVIATVDQLIHILGEPVDDSNTGQDKVNFEWEKFIVTGKQIGRASCRERVSSPV